MKRCTACFRYSLGDPSFCTHCGRSYDVRWCPRGHRNARGAQFCAVCGSGDLSTPAPPADLWFRLSQATLRVFIPLALVLVGVSVALALLSLVDWPALESRLILLGLVIAFLYWTTTLLPGPVRKVGRAAGKAVWHIGRPKRKEK